MHTLRQILRIYAPLGLLGLMSCWSTELSRFPRPALPMPAEIASRYEVPGQVSEVQLVPLTTDEATRVDRGIVRAGSEEAEFYYLRPEGPGPHPTVVLLPILAGGDALMWTAASSLVDRDVAVLWTRRSGSALKPGQRAPELEELFRRTVIHNRMVLAWARTQPDLDASRIGLVGLSTGGIVGGVLLAIEPDVGGGVLCLAGGDLPRLLDVSAENRIVKWRRWRNTQDGIGDTALREELEAYLVSDPALLGGYVDSERVLLVGATFDQVVPRRHQTILWEALGRPRRVDVGLSHYTAALALGTVLDIGCEFLRTRFDGAPAAP